MIQASRKQWIKFGVVTVLYLIFLVWLRSWLGLIVLPFIFDAYITHKIPWTWWKKSKNPTVRGIMGWVDAIVFALVAVYFVNLYFFQNYVIPSSSLEKSLLVGDYLFVSKMSYGARIPQTPLHMPLTQHTLPVFNCKSYLEWPAWDYKRVGGLGEVQLNDIVVFNFPAGDSVATGVPAEDLYRLSYQAGKELSQPIDLSALTPEQERTVYDLYYAMGRKYIDENPQLYGKVITRPVDRRENYVKRCVGLPGQTLEIKDRIIYLDGKPNKEPDNVQYRYLVYTNGVLPEEFCHDLGISHEDLMAYYPEESVYNMPLTAQAKAALENRKDLVFSILNVPDDDAGGLYPAEVSGGMVKRAAFARAIIEDPEVLLFDEPTSGLDPVMSRTVDHLIVQINRSRGAACVVVTHDLAGALRYADRIAFLKDGRFLEVATPVTIARSEVPEVRAFLAAQQMEIPHA